MRAPVLSLELFSVSSRPAEKNIPCSSVPEIYPPPAPRGARSSHRKVVLQPHALLPSRPPCAQSGGPQVADFSAGEHQLRGGTQSPGPSPVPTAVTRPAARPSPSPPAATAARVCRTPAWPQHGTEQKPFTPIILNPQHHLLSRIYLCRHMHTRVHSAEEGVKAQRSEGTCLQLGS